VSNLDDEHEQHLVPYLIDHPVVSGSQPIDSLVELLHPRRARILTKSVDSMANAASIDR
jgi:hypothetical protein